MGIYKRDKKRYSVKKCKECRKSIYNDGHHFLCQECWEKFKLKRIKNERIKI